MVYVCLCVIVCYNVLYLFTNCWLSRTWVCWIAGADESWLDIDTFALPQERQELNRIDIQYEVGQMGP